MSRKKTNKIRKRFKKASSLTFQKINSSIEFDKFLYQEDIEGSIAHASMLASQKIITDQENKKITTGLRKILKEIKTDSFKFDPILEDIHMNIESRLEELIGDTAGKLHTARSRNDQVVTDLKLWMKKDNELISKKIKELKLCLIKNAEANVNNIMPGLTHFQTAQPISIGHYFMSYYEMFNRDSKRFEEAKKRIDENPLGSGALAGTSFNINRNKTSKLLGFKRVTRNSIDSVSDRDFVIDFLSNSSTCAVHLSRISEEITLLSSDLIQFFKISDQVMSSSSIMPQKKNPDATELIRAKAAIVISNLNGMLNLIKSLPLAYSKDLQEDKKLVTSTSETIHLCLDCIIEILKGFKINKKNIDLVLKKGYANATELADWLVQNLDYSFRDAHTLTAKIVNFAEKKGLSLNELKISDYQSFDNKINKNLYNFINIKNSVNNKKSYGGTNMLEVKKMIALAKKEIKK
mgnify:FL=1